MHISICATHKDEQDRKACHIFMILNLYSRGRVLKMASFEGSGYLGYIFIYCIYIYIPMQKDSGLTNFAIWRTKNFDSGEMIQFDYPQTFVVILSDHFFREPNHLLSIVCTFHYHHKKVIASLWCEKGRFFSQQKLHFLKSWWFRGIDSQPQHDGLVRKMPTYFETNGWLNQCQWLAWANLVGWSRLMLFFFGKAEKGW